MRKHISKLALCLSCAFMMIGSLTVIEAEDYSDSSYWASYCSKTTNDNRQACKGYVEYLQQQKSDAAAQLKEIEAQRSEIAANLAKYDTQMKEYKTQISNKQSEIDAKQAEIDAKQVEIDDKQVDIDNTQAEVDSLEEKVKTRMVSSQGTMRVSKYFDILMGASSFEEFIRIANGLSAISENDENTLDQLTTAIEKLNKEKQELEEAKTQLETAKSELVDQQNDLILLQEQLQVIIDEQEATAAELEAQGDQISANIDSIKKTINSIDLDGVVTADGWTWPVPGAYRSAGTWNYSGGGKHLGYDFAASAGTEIRAVANGVVINSADGCQYGGLGSTCHGTGGSSGGGNQVYLLVSVNDRLYAVKYLHMQYGSPIATGTKVSSGDYVGRVGSTGNSSGAHCHIEIFYLGDASNFSSYAKNWSGDLTFGCGWAGSYDGYGRRCDSGYGAPCRIRPESVFGS